MRFLSVVASVLVMMTACSREAEQAPAAARDTAALTLQTVLPQLQMDADPELLLGLIDQIGRLDDGSPAVLEACGRLLSHTDARVREAVLEELWFLDDISSLLPVLTRCLYDADPDVRALAVERIGEIEKPAAVEVLIQNLTNSVPDVPPACEEALLMAVSERLNGPEEWYQWWEENRETLFED